jgi:S-formylglutathione hydrolase FrmB
MRALRAVATSELGRLLGLAGDVRIDYIDSPALRGNALGDPATRPLAVYVPPGYDPEGSKRYPVLYVLHGYTGDVAALVAARPWETNVVQWADRLIVERTMPPALLVVVDGFTRLGGSQYVDSIHNGDYATYVVRDVIDYVDRSYRTIASDGGRGVLGKSSGGFASMYLVMERPGVFGAFASHSGDALFEQSYVPSFVLAQRTLEEHGNDIGAFVAAFERKPKRKPHEYSTIEMLGYASAYSPRAAEPFALDLPWDEKTGAVVPEVMERWLAFDPCRLCLRKGTELGRLRLRYVDCGRRDEYALDVGARVFVQRVRELGLSVEHQEFDDDHRNVGYRYAVSLPALAWVLER